MKVTNLTPQQTFYQGVIMNDDTEEVVNWFLNDEYLYNNRHSSVKVLKELWSCCQGYSEVDNRKVHWAEVQTFLSED